MVLSLSSLRTNSGSKILHIIGIVPSSIAPIFYTSHFILLEKYNEI